MIFSVAADIVLLLHLGFIVFAAGGGLLALRWRWLAWLHLPAMAWAAFIEITAGICPLTPLENMLRKAAGQETYPISFIEHYIVPVIYPAGLSRDMQIAIGAGLAGFYLVFYAALLIRHKTARRQPPADRR